ncbi:C2 family cysteine protease [Streptomyces sp. NBC_00249]|uniref:C2 family cysteine protease n=1 Tax=Streptomyces sp. NBC_00249 TaxID=2975690 RepID=UPI0022585F80|nr:C2 family cysteine protease [Streptomyces sp. NBC_00249]MCX5199167.1 C2 family cysteine protease [Streptomyces sp. NBC_00249]
MEPADRSTTLEPVEAGTRESDSAIAPSPEGPDAPVDATADPDEAPTPYDADSDSPSTPEEPGEYSDNADQEVPSDPDEAPYPPEGLESEADGDSAAAPAHDAGEAPDPTPAADDTPEAPEPEADTDSAPAADDYDEAPDPARLHDAPYTPAEQSFDAVPDPDEAPTPYDAAPHPAATPEEPQDHPGTTEPLEPSLSEEEPPHPDEAPDRPEPLEPDADGDSAAATSPEADEAPDPTPAADRAPEDPGPVPDAPATPPTDDHDEPPGPPASSGEASEVHAELSEPADPDSESVPDASEPRASHADTKNDVDAGTDADMYAEVSPIAEAEPAGMVTRGELGEDATEWPDEPQESGGLDTEEYADQSGVPEDPEERHTPGAFVEASPGAVLETLTDSAEDENRDETRNEAPDAAEDGHAAERASIRDTYSKVRDAVLGPREPAEGSVDAYALVDRPAFNAMDLPEYGVRLFQYGTPLDRPDGRRVPLFDGPPRREQTEQGALGDCGVIATMGAVAGHLPEAISKCIKENGDGTYEVTFHQVKKDFNGDWTPFEPTGAVTVLTVAPDLVVPYNKTDTPAYAQLAGGVAWSAILEKAFAGVDQTWEEGRLKRTSGYQRLDLGTGPRHRAEMLTQLTGRPAYTEDFPTEFDRNGMSANRQLLGSFREKLEAGCPILIATRKNEKSKPPLPDDLVEGHVYEVTRVDGQGKIYLRNPHNLNHPEEPLTADQLRDSFAHRFTTMG